MRSRNVELDELATVGSIVMGERSFHETGEDSDNDDGATVQPHEDTADVFTLPYCTVLYRTVPYRTAPYFNVL